MKRIPDQQGNTVGKRLTLSEAIELSGLYHLKPKGTGTGYNEMDRMDKIKRQEAEDKRLDQLEFAKRINNPL